MEINWRCIPLTHNWAAVDLNGCLWAFIDKPQWLICGSDPRWYGFGATHIDTGFKGGPDAIYHRGVDSAFQLKKAVEDAEYQQKVKAAEPTKWDAQKIAKAIYDLQISEVVKTSDEIAAKFGAIKHDQDKPRYDLLPGDALHQVVLAFTYGATKYSPRNWEQGMAWGRLFAALMRHCWAFWCGEDTDPDTGLHPLAHAGACVLMLLASVGRGIGTDDRRE